VLSAAPALGHAPPQATGAFSAPGRALTAPQWVRTNRGIISKSAPNQPLRLLCNGAYRASLSEVTPMIAAPDGLIVASYDGGMQRIAADECSVQPIDAAIGDRHIADLAVSPDGSRYLALLTPSQTSAGSVLASSDAGRSWIGAAQVPAFGTGLSIAPSDPNRVYVTADEETDNGEPSHVLLSSHDGGATFSTSHFTLADSEVRAYVLGVDPLDADRVFLRTLPGNSDSPERLLLSEDGGGTVSQVYASVGPLAFAMDANSAWLGGRDGLFQSSDRGKTFQFVGDSPMYVGCLAIVDDSLLVCGYQANEFGVFRMAAGRTTFDSEIRFADVRSRPACSDQAAVVTECEADFAHWLQEEVPIDDTPAAANTASAPAGCSFRSASGPSSVPVAFLFALGCWRRRRTARGLIVGTSQRPNWQGRLS